MPSAKSKRAKQEPRSAARPRPGSSNAASAMLVDSEGDNDGRSACSPAKSAQKEKRNSLTPPAAKSAAKSAAPRSAAPKSAGGREAKGALFAMHRRNCIPLF